jgi:hypothetical protein
MYIAVCRFARRFAPANTGEKPPNLAVPRRLREATHTAPLRALRITHTRRRMKP